ncbi:formylglycine-generating enzyme family protein [uncultured Prevotella sp.]|uniref:formylglycine-generating enzyme family protein n=1 Tax=uncultured Prevotella sp. TaxID=159272 RepID=UPI002804D539|nr:formylglycine-generating enzyme family protein [uncultured Prevotella sp.]
MCKILLSFFLLFAALSSALAQKLTVESFKLAGSDLTAQTQPRKDLNDRNCALIKVGVGLQGVQFEGGIMGNVENKTGEYWVYMPQGNRQLKVKHANYAPVMVTFADYGVEKLESNRTYELIITASGGTQVAQKQRLTIRYSPSSATVLVDNKMVKGTNGVASTTLPVGQHSYIVFCDGYDSEEGMVKLKASTPSNLQITLSKEATAIQQSPVSQPTVAQEPVAQTPVTNVDNISIPVKDGISIEMVRVEAGTFTMGATAEMENPLINEKPAHQVTLTNDYYIGKYEVTQALWQAVMGNNPSKFKGENLPVEKVSWDDCQEFLSLLNRITSKTFRLPTEAEWEYAARGGNKNRDYQYSGSNNILDVAWCLENSERTTHPVGSKQPNELGIHDMSGNVREWCQDWQNPYLPYSKTNPTGGMGGFRRINRGGSWYGYASCCRLSYRGADTPDERDYDLGLRLVLSE